MPQLWNDIETLEDKKPELPYNGSELATNRSGRCAGRSGTVSTARAVVVTHVTEWLTFLRRTEN